MSSYSLTVYFCLTLYDILFMDVLGFFTHTPSEEHLGCFQVSATISKSPVNICIQVLCGHDFQPIQANTQEYGYWIIW
jgi:hypothetical protein